ncbi:DoxX family protein [Labilibacter sediminis]|nr:DoxX family protein [Labilibacter sediminis]
MNKNSDIGILILRLTLGVLMLFHGMAKLINGLSGIQGLLTSKGLPAILSYGVYIGEIIIPLLIITGYRTRLASVIFVVNMIFALLLVHANDIFSLSKTGGWAVELIGLYLFGAIALFFTGAGKYALSSSSYWD